MATAGTEPAAPEPPRSWQDRLLAAPRWIGDNPWQAAFWLIALGVGIAMRQWILHTSLGTADLDESTVGIQATRFRPRAFDTFFLNQASGGTVETGLVAFTFRLFGTSVTTLKLVPMVSTLVAAVLAYRTAVRLELGRTGQWVAPVLVWCGARLRRAVRASAASRRGPGPRRRVPLHALRLAERPAHHDVLLLGACVGLGWWQTPLTFLVAVPAVLWLIRRARPSIVRELG